MDNLKFQDQADIAGGELEEDRDEFPSSEIERPSVADDRGRDHDDDPMFDDSEGTDEIDEMTPDATATRPPSTPNPPGTKPDRNSL